MNDGVKVVNPQLIHVLVADRAEFDLIDGPVAHGRLGGIFTLMETVDVLVKTLVSDQGVTIKFQHIAR